MAKALSKGASVTRPGNILPQSQSKAHIPSSDLVPTSYMALAKFLQFLYSSHPLILIVALPFLGSHLGRLLGEFHQMRIFTKTFCKIRMIT